MCRLLAVKSERKFDIGIYLERFAQISKNSKEYQGHGWGCAFIMNGRWQFYKDIKPIWEDDLGRFGKTTLLIAHARSAFKDEGIQIENNMPFYDSRYVFIFNGELRGVSIKEEGRIGAEKLFNFIKRFDKKGMEEALRKGIEIIRKRTRYVKAMNMIIAEMGRIYVASSFNEDPEYFTMHYRELDDGFIICSDPYPNERWQKIENNTIKVF